jgi:hypothetical protein
MVECKKNDVNINQPNLITYHPKTKQKKKDETNIKLFMQI